MSDVWLPEFPSLPEAQREFLAARVARVTALSARHAELRRTLLALGGLEVVPPRYDAFEAWQRHRDDWYTAAILDRGQTWSGDAARPVPGDESACHGNVARLFVAGRGAIATGYALAEDGLWREHSWVVDRAAGGPTLLETTTTWLLYHGCVLDDTEATRFARDERGAEAAAGVV